MKPYDHKEIEAKWQKQWEETGLYKTKETSDKPKCYVLDMFPYPSGEGLHVGHPKGYIATDVYSRFKQMSGFNILHPMGWDAFGLPAENYAIKNKVHPSVAVEKNVKRFKEQLSVIGFNYDWDREIATSDPDFYRWTQWIFLQLFKKGLAYESHEPINWCPSCQTGLANEDLEAGKCERCGSVVEKKPIRQWVLKITDYADRMLEDLPALNWPEAIKESQKNWIGRSEGVNFKCKIKDLGIEVEMYNSVPQSYCAETFTVIAPDHPLLSKLVEGTPNATDVLAQAKVILDKRAADKFGAGKEMDGIFTGRYIENFAGTGRDLPIWVASYVLSDYGTGIVNASAHDERDYEFAKKYNIPLHEVLEPLVTKESGDDAFRKNEPISERRAVVAVIKHWSEDKYLGVHWKKTNWHGFVIGGIEQGEDAVAAGLREIVEETGYKNAELIKPLGGKVHARFYQMLKKENRVAHFEPFLFQLKNDERGDIDESEKELHDLVWLTPEEMTAALTLEDMKIVWSRVLGIEKPIIKNGILNEPTEFIGREWNEVRQDVIDYLVKNNFAERKVNYKLKDWVFSRQRYWGEPIPLIHCEKCGVVAVPEKDLPVKLPDVEHYEPTGTGESPLANIAEWVNTTCPECGGAGKRETNTMPQWAGSSWYYLRYIDPKNTNALVDKTKEQYWSPIDFYVGGAEHATRHLIYARFWHKFLFDIGVVNYTEPFKRLQHVGLILAEDGRKMSKRWGNVINPDEVIGNYGADTLRLYEMFMGPFDQAVAWSSESMIGPRRFVERVWRLRDKVNSAIALPSLRGLRHESQNSLSLSVNQTIKKVGEDIEEFRFNTAISSLMILVNEIEKADQIDRSTYEIVLKLLAPFAPHVTEELWHELGNTGSIHTSDWPVVDQSKLISDEVAITIQVNGKVRTTMVVPRDLVEAEAVVKAKSLDVVQKWLGDNPEKKIVYIPNKTLNIVI